MSVIIVIVQLPCLTPYNPMDCSMPGFPVLHHLPDFAQIHVHWKSVMLSNQLILCCLLLLLPSVFPCKLRWGHWMGLPPIWLCPYKTEIWMQTYTHTHGKAMWGLQLCFHKPGNHQKEKELEESRLSAFEGSTGLPVALSQTSSLQSSGIINFFHLSHQFVVSVTAALTNLTFIFVRCRGHPGFPGGSVGKKAAFSAGDIGNTGSIPGLGWCSGGAHGNPFRYSWLENSHGQRSLVGYSSWGHKELDTCRKYVCVECTA